MPGRCSSVNWRGSTPPSRSANSRPGALRMNDGPDLRARAKDIFADVVDAPSAERAALLEARCGADPVLRREVQSLLGAAQRGADFLAQPAATGASLPAGAAFPPGAALEEAGSRVGPYRLLQLIG